MDVALSEAVASGEAGTRVTVERGLGLGVGVEVGAGVPTKGVEVASPLSGGIGEDASTIIPPSFLSVPPDKFCSEAITREAIEAVRRAKASAPPPAVNTSWDLLKPLSFSALFSVMDIYPITRRILHDNRLVKWPRKDLTGFVGFSLISACLRRLGVGRVGGLRVWCGLGGRLRLSNKTVASRFSTWQEIFRVTCTTCLLEQQPIRAADIILDYP